jgi:hypothetical protein
MPRSPQNSAHPPATQIVLRLVFVAFGFGFVLSIPHIGSDLSNYVGHFAMASILVLLVVEIPLIFIFRAFERRQSGSTITGRHWRPVVVRDATVLPVELPLAYEAAILAVNSIPGVSIRSADSAGALIKAEIPMSWESHGERLVVRLKSRGPRSTEVVVKSSPKLPTTLFDGGKNRQNVDLVIDSLKSNPGRD